MICTMRGQRDIANFIFHEVDTPLDAARLSSLLDVLLARALGELAGQQSEEAHDGRDGNCDPDDIPHTGH